MINFNTEISALANVTKNFQRNAEAYLNNSSKPVEVSQQPSEISPATVDNAATANEGNVFQLYTSMIQAERTYEAVASIIKTKEEMSDTLMKVI